MVLEEGYKNSDSKGNKENGFSKVWAGVKWFRWWASLFLSDLKSEWWNGKRGEHSYGQEQPSNYIQNYSGRRWNWTQTLSLTRLRKTNDFHS